MPLVGKGLRHRVTLQRDEPNSVPQRGQHTPNYVAYRSNIPALVEQISLDEEVNADQKQAIMTHSVRIRKNGEVSATDRVLWNGHILNIVEVVTDIYGTWQSIKCLEKQ